MEMVIEILWRWECF